jgi:hypothetical protein
LRGGKLKKNSFILLVVIAGIVVGLQINKQNDILPIDTEISVIQEKNVVSNGMSTGLTPRYLIDYLTKNGFLVSPVEKGKMSDIYSANMNVGNTNIVIYVDIYHERNSDQIKLIETTLDGSYYVTSENQEEAEELVTKVATNYLIPLASLPYRTSKPEEAKEWVRNNISDSYDDEPKEKTTTKIGLCTFSIYGNPLMRTFEMDFGYSDINIEE